MSTIKVAFIVNKFPTLSETFILNQITGLLDLGHEVDIFARRKGDDLTIHSDVETYSLLPRTFYHRSMPTNKLRRIIEAIQFLVRNFNRGPIIILRSLNVIKHGIRALSLQLLYEVIPFLERGPYDIIHCHFGPNGNFGVGLRKLGIPGKLVTTFHGYDTRLGIRSGEHIYQTLFEEGDCFIAVSRYNYEYLVNSKLTKEKIIYHPIGIDLGRFFYKRESASFQDVKLVKLLTISRLVEEKGLHYGIKAIKKLLEENPRLNLEYNIIGGGHLEKELEGLINELSLERVVHLLGPQRQKRVVQMLQQSHIFFLPSIAESFGVVLLEAQAVGLPVVVTSVGGTSQAIINGKSGFLVPTKDVAALAERLEYLIMHPGMWGEMGNAGRKYVEKHYNIDKLNERLVRIYQQLLEKTDSNPEPFAFDC